MLKEITQILVSSSFGLRIAVVKSNTVWLKHLRKLQSRPKNLLVCCDRLV